MNPDIQFGELEESRPEQQLRPDANRHFSVVALGAPRQSDLPVFIDLDVLGDVTEHALSDTGVELGGVLLGGQYEDAEGKPFVVVSDSLRAQHYESTNGSFKFTHDTWEQITREREQFPPDLQMVGWYHTHPGWGVFLSSMDTFICDHFFNRPLDVALVIDPCRHQRGVFQWAGQDPQRLRQTGGFFLTASRFRRDELEGYAAYLEEDFAMSHDPRARAHAPIVHLADGQLSWQNVAILGSMLVQFCVLALLAWRILAPPPAQDVADVSTQAQLATHSLTTLIEQRQSEAEVSAKLDLLDEVVGQLDGGGPGLVHNLAEKDRQLDELQATIRGQRALAGELDGRIAVLLADLKTSQYEREQTGLALKELKTSLDQLQRRDAARLERIAKLETQLATYEDPDGQTEEATEDADLWTWTWLGIGSAAAVLALGAIAGTLVRWRQSRRQSSLPSEKPDAATNTEETPSQEPPM